jgi:hypothetical protein
MRRNNSETATYKEKRNLFSFISVLRRAPTRARPSGLVCARMWLRVRLVRTDSCTRVFLSPLYAYVQTDFYLCGYVLRVGGIACSHSDVRTERSDQNRMLFPR